MVMVIGLLIFFSGAGTLFDIIFLMEALMDEGNADPCIATLVCIIIMCGIICYIRVKEMSDMADLAVIGVFGFVQLIILWSIKTSYWEEDTAFIRICAAFGSQLLIYLIGRGISCIAEDIFERKARKLVSKIRFLLNEQINTLNVIAQEVDKVNASYRMADHLVNLISKISDDELKNTYVNARMHKDSKTLSYVAEVSAKNSLHITTDEKTLSEVAIEVHKIIQDKNESFREIVNGNYSKKDCKLLKEKWKAVKRKN